MNATEKEHKTDLFCTDLLPHTLGEKGKQSQWKWRFDISWDQSKCADLSSRIDRKGQGLMNESKQVAHGCFHHGVQGEW
jgi:hypothetical protein